MAEQLPRHLGLILDGNRRWAKAHNMPSLKGHKKGYENLKDIALEAFHLGIPYISAFIFSTENWNRSKSEVTYLMSLIRHLVERDLTDFVKQNIKLVFVGAKEGLPSNVWQSIDKAVKATAKNTGGTLGLCINYGGQHEIADALRKLLRHRVDPNKLTKKEIEKALYAPELPPIDLVVRTSGEFRLSGFMLYRIAYAELVFIDKHWPDFSKQDLRIVLSYYSERSRRFGK
jgi:undecaprenyl diphosphate synthase